MVHWPTFHWTYTALHLVNSVSPGWPTTYPIPSVSLSGIWMNFSKHGPVSGLAVVAIMDEGIVSKYFERYYQRLDLVVTLLQARLSWQ